MIGSILLLLTGCELKNSFEGLAQELANPEAQTVDGEGDQVISGSYSELRFDGNNADGTYVVAIEEHDQLVLVNFDTNKKCKVGPADGPGQRYTLALSRSGHEAEPLEALIPYLSSETDEDPEKLKFTDFDCKVRDVSVDNADLPLLYSDEFGFLVQTSKGELYTVDPWRDKKQLIAEDAAVMSSGTRVLFAKGVDGDWMWTVEGGEVVARDSSLKEVARFGHDVSRFRHSSSGEGGPMVSFRQAGDIYLALVSALDSPELLTEDGCGEGFDTGDNGREIFYYAPCDARDLKVKELDNGTVRDIADGVQNYRIVGSYSTGPIALYLTQITEDSGESKNVGELWAKFGSEPAVKLGNDGHLKMTHLNSSGYVRTVINWKDGGGKFVRGQLGEDLEEVAKGVAYFSSLGIISDFDGMTGKLQRFDDDNNLVLIHPSVSTRGIRRESALERALVVTDYDGEFGTLTLVQSGETMTVSKNVRPGAYVFTKQLPTVTFLSDWDSETGTATLKLKYIKDKGLDTISEGVSESIEVSWPKQGFLYSVPEGDRAGIWFTKAQL